MRLGHTNYQNTYILGIGNLGKYVAHALAKHRDPIQGTLDPLHWVNPSTTLLFHREELARDWKHAGARVGCLSYHGERLQIDNAYDLKFEVISRTNAGRQEVANRPIRNLIVATKAHATVAALKPINHRLNANSRILFLQNGMGITEEVSHYCFPHNLDRPRFWVGICKAGISPSPRGSPFDFLRAASGPLTIGFVQHPSDKPLPPKTCYDTLGTSPIMIKRLANNPLLHTEVVLPDEIKRIQLKKLVVNAAINPLTALFRCKNGQVFNSEARMDLLSRLVEEAGPIVRALQKSPGPDFSDSALREEVLRVARATGENSSSMLQDVEAGRKTEIDYINGYLVANAGNKKMRIKNNKMRLPCTHHAALVRMVSTPEAEWLPEDLELIQAARNG